jgi:histidyl-tRNA synthetase
MVAQKQGGLVFPIRWWSFGPFWRYERPQKGRTREFFQWNVDLLGADSPEADAEMVAVLATFFKTVGLTPQQVLILVNDRRLMERQFDAFRVPGEMRPNVSSWIDRRGKLEPEAWEAYGSEIGLTGAQTANLKSMLDDKALWEQSEELQRFFRAIEALGLSEYVQFDPSIVRGLLYYTGTVIEAWEVGGEVRRSILGGGRYDNLLADVGGQPLPAVGYAMGDVVISLILDKYGLLPKDLGVEPAQVLVTVFDQARLLDSFKLAAELRRAGLKTICYPEPAKLPKQFKYADKYGLRVAIVIGPDEVAKGQITIKDLASGQQQTVERGDTLAAIQRILASDSG